MPKPPAPPQHRIDPAHNGDGRAVHSPTSRDGRPVTEKPLRDAHGRDVAPDRDRINRIDRDDFRRDLHGVQDHWNSRNHGYDWHSWNGWNVCHHYDEFGYHWWGFYVGEAYFWTRFFDDNYWWWDPYWHRWDYMHDGQWWWNGPDGFTYVYVDGVYYRYGVGDGGVIMTPDPTPPVDVPPGDPAPANQVSVYSQDGTRSVSITGDAKDAFLYDLTVADPQGLYLASDVASAAFVDAADGSVSRVVLTMTDGSTLTFDRDGASLDGSSSPAAQAVQPPSDASMIQTLQQKMQGSETLRALRSGFGW